MSSAQSERKYLPLDPSEGFPSERGVFFECLECGGVVPSIVIRCLVLSSRKRPQAAFGFLPRAWPTRRSASSLGTPRL